nr:MAG TPA: hypothetical protein [Caudoviricetes sp.]
MFIIKARLISFRPYYLPINLKIATKVAIFLAIFFIYIICSVY